MMPKPQLMSPFKPYIFGPSGYFVYNNNKWFILVSLYSNQMCRDLLVFCYNENEMQYKSEEDCPL